MEAQLIANACVYFIGILRYFINWSAFLVHVSMKLLGTVGEVDSCYKSRLSCRIRNEINIMRTFVGLVSQKNFSVLLDHLSGLDVLLDGSNCNLLPFDVFFEIIPSASMTV